MLSESSFVRNNFPNFDVFVHTCNSLYYQALIWIGYVVIALILSFSDFSLFGLAQMIILAILFVTHLFKMKKHAGSAHQRMFAIWNVFVLSSAVVACLKYLYSFTT